MPIFILRVFVLYLPRYTFYVDILTVDVQPTFLLFLAMTGDRTGGGSPKSSVVKIAQKSQKVVLLIVRGFVAKIFLK